LSSVFCKKAGDFIKSESESLKRLGLEIPRIYNNKEVINIIREQRIEKIISEIKRRGVVSTDELTKELHVSRSTIHRDLCDLEEANELKCIRGGAVALTPKTSYEPSFDVRKDMFLDEKKRIAAAALSLVQENETLILDSGTTVYEVAKALTGFKKLYIATNDLKSALALSVNHDISLIVLGGSLRNSYYSLNGIFTENIITQIHADKVFLGVDAVDLGIGFTNYSVDEINVKRLMIQASHQVIVLCDHSKFESIAFANICHFSDVDMIITGKEIDKRILRRLEEKEIKVMVV